jgi:Uma2 family endonuclease
MHTIVVQEEIRIPPWVVDLESFRRWAKSDEFPESGRMCHLDGELWVDVMPEQLFSHNDVKLEFAEFIRGIFKHDRRGRFFGDRSLVTNTEAGLSTEPDGTVVLYESEDAGRVRFVEGAVSGFVEIEGSPDLTLEVVSDSSVEKDVQVLRELYWKAGVTEYWLIDVRREPLQFDVLRRGRRGFVASRKNEGWVKSAVVGRQFRLTHRSDRKGRPEFILTVR